MISGIGLVLLLVAVFAPDLLIMPFAIVFWAVFEVFDKATALVFGSRPYNPKDDRKDSE